MRQLDQLIDAVRLAGASSEHDSNSTNNVASKAEVRQNIKAGGYLAVDDQVDLRIEREKVV